MAGSINESRFDVRTAENHKESVGCHYSLYLIKGLVFYHKSCRVKYLAQKYPRIWLSLHLWDTASAEHVWLWTSAEEYHQVISTMSVGCCTSFQLHPFPLYTPIKRITNQPPKNPALFFQNKSTAWFCFTFFITMTLFWTQVKFQNIK